MSPAEEGAEVVGQGPQIQVVDGVLDVAVAIRARELELVLLRREAPDEHRPPAERGRPQHAWRVREASARGGHHARRRVEGGSAEETVEETSVEGLEDFVEVVVVAGWR